MYRPKIYVLRADLCLVRARSKYAGKVIYLCLVCAKGNYITRWLLVLTIYQQYAGGCAIYEPYRFTSCTQDVSPKSEANHVPRI